MSRRLNQSYGGSAVWTITPFSQPRNETLAVKLVVAEETKKIVSSVEWFKTDATLEQDFWGSSGGAVERRRVEFLWEGRNGFWRERSDSLHLSFAIPERCDGLGCAQSVTR